MTRAVKPLAIALAFGITILFALAMAPASFAITTEEIVVSAVTSEDGQNCAAWVSSNGDIASFSFEAKEWDGTYSETSASVYSDTNTNGYSCCYLQNEPGDEEDSYREIAWLKANGKGTHKIVVRQTFYNAKGKAVHRIDYNLSIKLKCPGVTKDSIVSYKGKKTTLKTQYLSGTVTWKSTNSKVATVTSKGVVKGKALGKCYITATGVSAQNGEILTTQCLAEVTYKKAYVAVQNAWKDYRNPKLKYSQEKRMKKNYRDCSSYVGRCYWDTSLNRKLMAIGGVGAKYWSYNAAGQAKWLNSHGKRVAKKAVSLSKLLPGDTIYYETDYAGRNDQYRHIDHVGIYVGNGVVLNTSSNGDFGCIGNRGYYKYDSSIKFIGRPCK